MGVASLRWLSRAVSHWVSSRVLRMRLLLLWYLRGWCVFNVVDVFSESICYFVLVFLLFAGLPTASLVLVKTFARPMLIFVDKIGRAVMHVLGCRLLLHVRMSIFLGYWPIPAGHLWITFAHSGIRLRVHCVRNGTRCCPVTLTLFYFWSGKLFQISNARFQSFDWRFRSTSIVKPILAARASWVLSCACRVCSVISMCSRYSCSETSFRAQTSFSDTSGLRVEISGEAGCVVVGLQTSRLRGWLKI